MRSKRKSAAPVSEKTDDSNKNAAPSVETNAISRTDGRWWLTLSLTLVALLGGLYVRIESKAERAQFDDIAKGMIGLQLTIHDFKAMAEQHGKDVDRLEKRMVRIEDLAATAPRATTGDNRGQTK